MLWSFVDRAHPDARPDSARLAATHYPFDVDFSGVQRRRGEFLKGFNRMPVEVVVRRERVGAT